MHSTNHVALSSFESWLQLTPPYSGPTFQCFHTIWAGSCQAEPDLLYPRLFLLFVYKKSWHTISVFLKCNFHKFPAILWHIFFAWVQFKMMPVGIVVLSVVTFSHHHLVYTYSQRLKMKGLNNRYLSHTDLSKLFLSSCPLFTSSKCLFLSISPLMLFQSVTAPDSQSSFLSSSIHLWIATLVQVPCASECNHSVPPNI